MVVISRLPRRGLTKTRLARGVGVDAALALHRAFLDDELDQLCRPDRWDLILVHDLAHEPGEAEGVCGGRARGLVPGEDNLPAELNSTFRLLLADYSRVVIVSGDVPQIDADVVAGAFAALDHADAVFGPGPDGGYSLVGLRAPHDLFTPVTMGVGAVYNRTRALAASLGLTVAEVACPRDIDEAQDLVAVAEAPPGVARATRRVMASLARGEIATQLPTELQVEVTSRCNLRCRACATSFASLSPARDLTLTEYREVTAGLPALERVTFQLNGEPTLNRELPAMIRDARARGIHTVVNSNGVVLDAARRAALLDAGLDELRVSLDGADAEAVRAMSGADTFGRVVENVTALVWERANRPTPRVGLWMVGTRRTIAQLPELVRLAHTIGADEVYLQRLVTFGQGEATEEQSLHGRVDDPLRELIGGAERLAKELGVALRASGRGSLLEGLAPSSGPTPQLGCWRPWRSAVVTASKKVLPCCISSFLAPYNELERGDLAVQGWEAIWNGSPYRALRRGILEGDPLPFCSGCGIGWSL